MPDGNNPRAVIGDNAPPAYRVDVVEAHDAKSREFLDAGGAWVEAGPVTDETQAGKLNDFLAGIKEIRKTVDADRKADKKPHDDAGKEVQAAYTPILNRIDKAIQRVTPLMTAWLAEVDRKQRAEAEAKRKAAEEAARKAAEEASKAAARNDFGGEADAEEAAKAAAKMQKEAERAAKQTAKATSATGAGRAMSFRTTWVAEITDLKQAFLQFATDPDLQATLIRLAEAKARSKGFDPATQTIPGFTLTPKRTAA